MSLYVSNEGYSMSKRKRYAAEHKFSKLEVLNNMRDEGGSLGAAARRESKRMSESWSRRQSNKTDGLWKRKHSKPSEVVSC